MKENDEKLPGIPGDEVDIAAENLVETDSEEEESEQIDENTIFTREELEMYDDDELEAIIDLQNKELPSIDDPTREDLIAAIIGEIEEEEESSEVENESEEEEAALAEEEAALAEEEAALAEEEATVVEEKKPKAKAAKKSRKPREAKVKEEESDAKEEEEEIESSNPVADLVEAKEKAKKPVVPKAKVEKDLPDAKVEDVKLPKVTEVKQSALTTIEKPNPNEAGVLEYRPGASLDDLLLGAQKLIDGGLACGHATPEAVLGVIKYGAEIGMNTMTSLNNIHMVQGKPTLGVHAITAQLKKFGVVYEILQNYEAEDDDDVVTTIKFSDLSMLEKYKMELKYASDNLRGNIQELYLEQVNDTLQSKISQIFSYRYSDAAQAGLISKSNWMNHPKIMLLNRCLTLGGRSFKPEALLGLSETMEYAEVVGAETEMEEAGHVVVLTD